jgi:hypothetical protein
VHRMAIEGHAHAQLYRRHYDVPFSRSHTQL